MRYLKGNTDIKKIIYLSLFAVLAIVLSVIETQLPGPDGVPGIKPGLANILAMVSLVFFSLADTILIIFIGCVMTSLFMGGPTAFVFSICGGILSTAVMWIMLKYTRKYFSFAGIGIAGAIAHNMGQMAAACFIMSDLSVAAYLPVLLVSGILTGSFTGICSNFIMKALKKLNFIEYI